MVIKCYRRRSPFSPRRRPVPQRNSGGRRSRGHPEGDGHGVRREHHQGVTPTVPDHSVGVDDPASARATSALFDPPGAAGQRIRDSEELIDAIGGDPLGVAVPASSGRRTSCGATSSSHRLMRATSTASNRVEPRRGAPPPRAAGQPGVLHGARRARPCRACVREPPGQRSPHRAAHPWAIQGELRPAVLGEALFAAAWRRPMLGPRTAAHTSIFKCRSTVRTGDWGAGRTVQLLFVFDIADRPWLHGVTGLSGPGFLPGHTPPGRALTLVR